jgi:2-dehydro-3-deoxygluconokinase
MAMNTNKGVVCFGELLLRMSPALGRQWISENIIPTFIGGAELNVATALANWKTPVSYFTALPQNYLSEEICEDLKSKSIDVSKIQFSGNRIGIYYLPQGSDLKNAGVIYDRAHSSFYHLKPNTIDWDSVFGDATWFHFGAINPALNENIVAVCKEALEIAEKRNMTISIDLNYRSKLWKYGKQPSEVMPDLVKHCNVVMGNIWAAHHLLGIPVHAQNDYTKAKYLEHSHYTAEKIKSQFPKCTTVSNTFRFDDGETIKYYAALHQDSEQFVSPEFSITEPKDKIGSGDCFMAGLIHSIYHNELPQHVINYAAAAAVGKLQEVGDATQQTTEQIIKTLQAYV